MTTLALNTPRAYEGGNRNDLPVIAADIIYEGAAVGVVAATGLTQPLVAGNKFAGFAVEQADNSSGVSLSMLPMTTLSPYCQLVAALSVTSSASSPLAWLWCVSTR